MATKNISQYSDPVLPLSSDTLIAGGQISTTTGLGTDVKIKLRDLVAGLLSPKGAFSTTTTYVNGNVVTYSGSAYLCVTTMANGITGIVPGADAASWSIFVEKGDAGVLTPEYQTILNNAIAVWDGAVDQVQAGANTATAQASAAANSATVANNASTSLQQALAAFRQVYLGSFAADPGVDGNGNPLVVGAEYFNTTENKLRVWDGTQWQDYDESVQTLTQNATLSAANAAASATTAANAAAEASNYLNSIQQANDGSQANADAAAQSATNAASSASAASASADQSSSSASSASTSATNAGNSASSASTSATNAGNSATAAATSASNASSSANGASQSATNASTSATNAANSATAASSSASSASTSASNASTSATNAANSATQAANSASQFSSIPTTYGTLTNNAQLTAASDLNSAPGGWSTYTNNTPNTPANYGVAQTFSTLGTNVTPANGVYVYQTAYDTGGSLYTRQNINGNGWSNWSALITAAYADSRYLLQTGGAIQGDLFVGGTLSVPTAASIAGLTVTGASSYSGTATITNNVSGNSATAAAQFQDSLKSRGVCIYPQMVAGTYGNNAAAGEAGIMTYYPSQNLFLGVPNVTSNGIRITGTGAYVYGSVIVLESRPTFAGKTPWDSGNLVTPVDVGSATGIQAGRNGLRQGLVEVARLTATNRTTSWDLPTLFSSNTEFDSYEIVGEFQPNGGNSVNGSASTMYGSSLYVRLSYDGSTFSTASMYQQQNDYSYLGDTSIGTNGGTGTAGVITQCIAGTSSQVASDVRKYLSEITGQIRISSWGETMISSDTVTVYSNSGNGAARVFQRWRNYILGTSTSTTIVPPTGIQFLMVGNAANTSWSGSIIIYGRRKSLASSG